jgi:hypothetical protein
VYVAVLTYAATREPPLAGVVAIVGAFGTALLAFVLVREHLELLIWPLGLAGAVYVVAIVVHGSSVDEGAPLVGAALLVSGELAAWSLDERRPVAGGRRLATSRAIAVAGLVLAGLAIGALVVALSAAAIGDGIGWTVLGAAAAVLVVAAAARLARQ